jgi:2-methylisocitrate lyase-like PEP mutase family enzyme
VSAIHAIDVVRDAVRDLVLTRARGLTRDLAPALDTVRDVILDRACERARTFADPGAASLAAALVHDLGTRTESFDSDVVYAVVRIEDAVTNLMGADLAHIGLDGIPLGGLRWSSATRWHIDWEEHVRRNSVEFRPDLYEVCGSAADVDGMVTDVTT